jgi:hypothetical protein
MNADECTELGHARWRVHFLHRILEAHRTAGHFHTESWATQEQAFLQQIAAAEECLRELETSSGGSVDTPADDSHPFRASGAPSDLSGQISRDAYARGPASFRVCHVFSSGSLSE